MKKYLVVFLFLFSGVAQATICGPNLPCTSGGGNTIINQGDVILLENPLEQLGGGDTTDPITLHGHAFTEAAEVGDVYRIHTAGFLKIDTVGTKFNYGFIISDGTNSTEVSLNTITTSFVGPTTTDGITWAADFYFFVRGVAASPIPGSTAEANLIFQMNDEVTANQFVKGKFVGLTNDGVRPETALTGPFSIHAFAQFDAASPDAGFGELAFVFEKLHQNSAISVTGTPTTTPVETPTSTVTETTTPTPTLTTTPTPTETETPVEQTPTASPTPTPTLTPTPTETETPTPTPTPTPTQTRTPTPTPTRTAELCGDLFVEDGAQCAEFGICDPPGVCRSGSISGCVCVTPTPTPTPTATPGPCTNLVDPICTLGTGCTLPAICLSDGLGGCSCQ